MSAERSLTVRYFSDRNLLVVRLSGSVSFPAFEERFAPRIAEAIREHSAPPPANRVYDLREFDPDWSIDEVQALVDWSRSVRPAEGSYRVAFIASGNLLFGRLRQFEALSKDPPVERGVFRDTKEALGWLGVDPGLAGEIGLEN